jgi:rubrerythrin
MHEPGKPRTAPDEYVEFFSAGAAVKGEYHCSGCGYGVAVHSKLPRCPMCGSKTWEQTPWAPFTRVQTPL